MRILVLLSRRALPNIWCRGSPFRFTRNLVPIFQVSVFLLGTHDVGCLIFSFRGHVGTLRFVVSINGKPWWLPRHLPHNPLELRCLTLPKHGRRRDFSTEMSHITNQIFTGSQKITQVTLRQSCGPGNGEKVRPRLRLVSKSVVLKIAHVTRWPRADARNRPSQ